MVASIAVVTFTANTIETDAAFAANTAVRTVFTFFTAVGADKGTFRASVTAGAYNFNTVFA